ncbi:MAG: N-acetylmuramoyl-L-alanine amidase [Actinobacteria bacterium]|nr:N-acetylmuramoyl-L-alanine amidase [Actinomycetota bacterium]
MKVKQGDRGPIVKEIQNRLLKLGYSVGPTHADGNFGLKTKEAVIKFQKKTGLKPTGIVDKETYQKLIFESYELGDRTLYLHYPFFKGRDVLELQKILKSFGFNPGPLDGIFGPLTEKAVREFQMSVGLVPDGIVGPQTITKLFDSARNFGSSSVVIYPEREIGLEPLKDVPIALDAGHGGIDPGAVGPSGLKESVIVRKIANEVENLLSGLGARVVRIYGKETNVKLEKRMKKAKEAQVSLVLSIHLNSSEKPEAGGCEVLYAGKTSELEEKSKRIAEILASEIATSLGIKCRGAKIRKELYILKNSDAPAVIIEPMFISNPTEEKMLYQEETIKKIASAITRGVLKYFERLRL